MYDHAASKIWGKLKKTKKISQVPIILVGVDFWKGMHSWIKETMLEKENNISPGDIDLIPMTDSPEEVVRMIRDFYEKGNMLEPNYEL